jgi:hypothetical protein
MNTWAIKNSLGCTVEPRFACNVVTPEEALTRYGVAAQMRLDPSEFNWTASLNLLGRVVMWNEFHIRHIAEVIEECGTMVRVSTGALVPRSCVTLFGVCQRCGKTPQAWLWLKGRPAVTCASCFRVVLETFLDEPDDALPEAQR